MSLQIRADVFYGKKITTSHVMDSCMIEYPSYTSVIVGLDNHEGERRKLSEDTMPTVDCTAFLARLQEHYGEDLLVVEHLEGS